MKKFLLLFTLFIAFGIAGCGDVANDIKNGDVTNPTKIAIDGIIGEYTVDSLNLAGSDDPTSVGSKVMINTQNYENLVITLEKPFPMVVYSADPASLMETGLSQNGNQVTFTLALTPDGSSKVTIIMTKNKSLTANQGVGTQGQNITVTVNNNLTASKNAASIPVELTHDVNKTFTVAALLASELTPGLYLASGPADTDFPSITKDEASSTATKALFNATTNGNLSSAYYLFEAENTTDGAISYGFLKTGDVTNPTKIAIDGIIGEYTVDSLNLAGSDDPTSVGSKVMINTQNYENLVITLEKPFPMVVYSADPASLMETGLSQNGNQVTFTLALTPDGSSKVTIIMTKNKSLTANQGVGTQGQNITVTVNNNLTASKNAASIPVELTHDVNKTFTVAALLASELTPGLYLASGPADTDFPSITKDEASSTATKALFNATTNSNLSSTYYLFEAENTTDGAISYGFLKTDVPPAQ